MANAALKQPTSQLASSTKPLKRRRRHSVTPRPFLKWVGGKGQLLDQIFEQLPSRFRRYHEPFTGGGAVFFGLWRSGRLAKKKAYLSDVNPELVDTYNSIKTQVEDVIEALSVHHYDSDYYYEVRAQDPWTLTRPQRAARMIFLNRCGFNGLYRVNKKGKFNVPFGRYVNPLICDEANLRQVSNTLQKAIIKNQGFETIVDRAQTGDLVYFDPPYVPVSGTSNFVSYAKAGFTQDDQEHLATIVETLSDKGVHVILSNSAAPWVVDRYSKFDVNIVPARRSINSKASQRGPVGEVVVVA
jgi:DNA adenine methylase